MKLAAFDYAFDDEALLKKALNRSGSLREFQRLEFLGDRMLGVVIGAWLYEKFPAADEGELSRRLTFLVRASTLVGVAKAWGLEKAVKLGTGETFTDGVLADTVEAVLGAVWLDGGLEAVADVVTSSWEDLIDLKDEKDAKTRLQEWLQGRGLKLPAYETVEERGMDHDKWFVVEVTCSEGTARGEGKSKQIAALAAAAKLMEKFDA